MGEAAVKTSLALLHPLGSVPAGARTLPGARVLKIYIAITTLRALTVRCDFKHRRRMSYFGWCADERPNRCATPAASTLLETPNFSKM